MQISKSGPKSILPRTLCFGYRYNLCETIDNLCEIIAFEFQHPIAGGSEIPGCSGAL